MKNNYLFNLIIFVIIFILIDPRMVKWTIQRKEINLIRIKKSTAYNL